MMYLEYNKQCLCLPFVLFKKRTYFDAARII